MKYQTADQARKLAAIIESERAIPAMARSERLTRWADLLEQSGRHSFTALHGTEYVAGAPQSTMRADDSPLSVAYADPILRGEGLAGDSYADVRGFFRLSHATLHRLVCYCHYGTAIGIPAAEISGRVRELARGARLWEQVLRLVSLFGTGARQG